MNTPLARWRTKPSATAVKMVISPTMIFNNVSYGGTASLDSEAVSDTVAKRLGYSRKTLIERVGPDVTVPSEAYLLER